MSDTPAFVPEEFEILKTIEVSGLAGEYIARHKVDGVLVKLGVFNLGQTTSATARRHLREYLRCDITFMEDIDQPGVIRVFNYSDTRDLFWIATRPAEVDKLSKRFDFLKSQSVQFRQGLIRQFFTALQRIHNLGVVHRNLSSESVFLSSELEIYIGDFGFACYSTDQPATGHYTSTVTTIGYQPPEVRSAKTFTCDVSCDIFSAGLLVFELLFASELPKDRPGEIHEVLRTALYEQVAKEIIGADTSEAIIKAVNPSPKGRWSTVEDFTNAFEESLQNKSPYASISIGSTPTVGMTKPIGPSETAPIEAASDVSQEPSEPTKETIETTDEITPLDPSHEIWNNHYEIIEKIGEGGQAVVYRAYDHLTNEEVAIKTIWSRHREDKAAINRLKQGAMIARSLTHRYIIKTYSVEQRIDTEEAGRYVFIVMELIKSRLELSDVIETRRTSKQKIRLDETLHIIRQLLYALEYAHEHTIHRDIKPGNIMLVPRDEQAEVDSSDLTKFDIRLIDFGIAKVLSQKHIDVTGKGFRSAHYGAPELADANTGVDARADIFSAGVIMYQMLTKDIPRKGSPPANKINKEVPAALAKVIDRAINADREKRFKTVSEFAKEINRAVSKFNWLYKTAKIAAVLLVIVCIAATVKYFWPEPDYMPVQQNIAILESRNRDKEIVKLANETVIKYSDIEGYDSYDTLRKQALEDLQTVKLAGQNKFKQSFPPWKSQEKVWVEVGPAIEKIENIAQNQREYYNHKNLAIAEHLVELSPSSEIVSEVKDKAEQAETRLATRPLKQGDLEFCADAYDLSAKVYTNIDILAGDSDALDTAEKINNKLKDIEKMRNDFLPVLDTISTIEPIKNSDLHQLTGKCLEKADRYYRSFSLTSAEKYFSLLNQICGTMAYVRGQVDFRDSDIGLISSRLMELCYEDIGTFENYPTWTERLQQVYIKKDILAKYKLLQNLLSKAPKDIPMTIYELTTSAKRQCEQGNVHAAGSKLTDAIEEYKKFMYQKINALKQDCHSLSTFSSVSADSMKNCIIGLEKLSNSMDELGWPQMNFADEYNRYSKVIKSQKDTLRQQLIQQAGILKTKIVNSQKQARQQPFFWESQLIGEYVSIAQKYDSDDVDSSIANWKYVEDLSRLSGIIAQMKNIDSRLQRMLIRKDQLDKLANDIDEGISFCEKFKGISDEERKKYRQWALELKQLRSKLTAHSGNTYLIDQKDEIFSSVYTSTKSAYAEIRAKLPYHRSRVIELINKTKSLEKNTVYLTELKQLWTDSLGALNISQVKLDFDKTREYLESIKEDVDKWPTDVFNQKLQNECNILAEALDKQSRGVANINSKVLEEKSKFLDGIKSFEKIIGKISSDEDIRKLDDLAAADKRETLLRFRRLPDLLRDYKRKFSNIVLDTAAVNVSPEDSSAVFEIDTWLKNFNTKKDLLDAQISQLKATEKTISSFQETRQILAKQSSIETDYYSGLRDCTVGLIDYSDITSKMEAVETDSAVVKMCQFLKDTGNDTIPQLGDLKVSVTAISKEFNNLKSLDINTISEAKDFNKKREQLLGHIATVRKDMTKLDIANLENNCKQSVAQGVDEITNLIGASQAEKLNRLISTLWAFYPEHKSWSQWGSFLELHHLAVSDKDIRLNSSELLRPVNEKGDYLSLAEIAANPKKVFYIDTGNSTNFGWPQYVNHQKDPTVVFAFIPGSQESDIEPFYMAIREVSNAQYILFMEEIRAKPTTDLAGWSYFGDQNNNLLIGQTQGQFPPCRITWDKSTSIFVLDEEFKHDPVTWVTSYGGQAYAKWLNAQLPTVSKHIYATRAGANTTYPWGEQLSNAASYAHVRSTAWQNAARQYNAKRDNPVEIAYAPVGAVKDFLRGKALDTAKIVYAEESNRSIWPCFTKNNQPNAWGLYDMIGNVWEWCVDVEDNSTPVICGGSCLCPPDYITPESKYNFKAQACDVGFRIVIPTK